MQRELQCTDIVNIINEYFSGSSQPALSERYGVSEKAIYNILYLRTYTECSKLLIKSEYGGQADYFISLAERKLKGLGRRM